MDKRTNKRTKKPTTTTATKEGQCWCDHVQTHLLLRRSGKGITKRKTEEEGLKRTDHLVSRKQTDQSVFFIVLGKLLGFFVWKRWEIVPPMGQFKKKKKSRFLFLFVCAWKDPSPRGFQCVSQPLVKIFGMDSISFSFSPSFSPSLPLSFSLELIQLFQAQLAQVGTERTWFRAVWVV